MHLMFMVWGVLTAMVSLERPVLVGDPALEITECDVKEIYTRMEVDRGTKVLDGYNRVSDAEDLLVPTRLDVGNYEVEVKRLAQNFYQVAGTSIVLETNYCLGYAAFQVDAILMVQSNYGYTKGTLIFE